MTNSWREYPRLCPTVQRCLLRATMSPHCSLAGDQGRGSRRGRGKGGNCPQHFVSMGWICLCPPKIWQSLGISTLLPPPPPPRKQIVPAPLPRTTYYGPPTAALALSLIMTYDIFFSRENTKRLLCNYCRYMCGRSSTLVTGWGWGAENDK